MADLNRKQKKFLDKWFKEHDEEIGVQTDAADLMSGDEWDELVEMKDFETLWQAVNYYIGEKI